MAVNNHFTKNTKKGMYNLSEFKDTKTFLKKIKNNINWPKYMSHARIYMFLKLLHLVELTFLTKSDAF